MTREEAIQVLTDIKRIRSDEIAEAVDMAIEALSEDISEDGTLKVKVKDGSKVNRVLVWGDNIFGGLYYPEANDEINEMNKEIIKDILKMMPTAYLLEALGVDTVDELMKSADAEQTDYKLPGHDEVMERLDNLSLEFTIHGKERVKRMVGDDK